MKRSEPIEKIRKRFSREWLLIEVTEMDEPRTVPRKGNLLFHSPHRDEAYKAMRGRPGNILITFSQDELPMGYAAAF